MVSSTSIASDIVLCHFYDSFGEKLILTKSNGTFPFYCFHCDVKICIHVEFQSLKVQRLV